MFQITAVPLFAQLQLTTLLLIHNNNRTMDKTTVHDYSQKTDKNDKFIPYLWKSEIWDRR